MGGCFFARGVLGVAAFFAADLRGLSAFGVSSVEATFFAAVFRGVVFRAAFFATGFSSGDTTGAAIGMATASARGAASGTERFRPRKTTIPSPTTVVANIAKPGSQIDPDPAAIHCAATANTASTSTPRYFTKSAAVARKAKASTHSEKIASSPPSASRGNARASDRPPFDAMAAMTADKLFENARVADSAEL